MRGDRDAFEDKYLDVMQNIEAPIVDLYRANPTMLDWDVEQALDALIRAYQAEERPRFTPAVRLSPLGKQLHDGVRAMCEWRLGRGPLPYPQMQDGKGRETSAQPEPKTLVEIIACLQRIRRSVSLWTREGGRQGYLTYVNRFFPPS